MTIWDLKPKIPATIESVDEAMHATLFSRLRELGFEPGLSITVLKRSPIGGPIVLQISDSVFTLERAVAEKIFVTMV